MTDKERKQQTMKPEELKRLIKDRKQRRKSDLELLKIAVLVYRRMIRKYDAEMDYYYRHHDRTGFQEAGEKYNDAVKAEAEARRKLYDLALSPLFTYEEHADIIQDLKNELELESISDAERVLHMLKKITDPELIENPGEGSPPTATGASITASADLHTGIF